MGVPTKISVLVCTYNRCRELGATIESLISQVVAEPWPWEIVVVDNNSTDATRQLIEDYVSRYPARIRYVFEKRQGISYARNTAIRQAHGEILAFIDDDEMAAPGWLWELTANLNSAEWAGAGGRVLCPDSFSPPEWLSLKSKFASGPIAYFDKGQDAGTLDDPPFGANMAFRKEVFQRCGLFRTDLGRSGKNLISNEDTEFGRRVIAAGLKLRYEPKSVTYHPVDERRLQKSYFLSWWFNKGRSDVRELGIPADTKRIFGVPIDFLRGFVSATGRWIINPNPSKRFATKVEFFNCAGQIVEAWHRARTNGPQTQSRQMEEL